MTPWGMVPEIFKSVEIPDMVQKNMDNDVTVVEKHPLVQGSSFPMPWSHFVPCQLSDDMIRDCFDLPLGRAGTDDKGIGNGPLNTR